jgi:flagellin
MALGVLNNINAIYAQNNLANTQASLSKTLQQLSSGSRINSGADDAAGLSLANGLQASSTALSQSAKNASEGVDFLQVADGALSQVTSLLNRAVTLATEASNGTLNASQVSAANSEYQKILTETDTINNNTEYNGISTFAKNSAYTVSNASDAVSIGSATTSVATVTYGSKTLNLENTLHSGSSTSGVIANGGTGTYILASTDTISSVASQINSQFGANVATVQGNQLVLSGGAAISSGSQALTTGGGGTTVTVANANDIITPGSSGIVYADHVGDPAAALGGAFGANGTGGTLAQLAAAINAVDIGAASVSGNTLTIGSSGGTITGVTSALVNGPGEQPSLVDTVKLPTVAVGGTGGVTSLTVGNAADTLSLSSGNTFNITATGGTAIALTGIAAGGSGNLNQLAADINTQFGSKGVVATVSGNTMNLTGGTVSASGAVTESEAANAKTNQTVAIFTSDGTISQSYNNSASDMVQTSSSALSLAGTDLTSTAGAQAALTAINAAITTVAAARGTLGANINTLTAVGNVMTMQSTNTLAAMNDVTATDYGQATSDMSKFQILSQTGIAALSQANQAQQLITKLLQ